MEEKLLTIPLRKNWVKKTRVKRANSAVSSIRSFISKHVKSGEIRISQKLNESLWSGGIKKPPARVRVKVVKDSDKVIVMLPDEKPNVPAEAKKKGKTEMKQTEASIAQKTDANDANTGKTEAPEEQKADLTMQKPAQPKGEKKS